MTAAEKLIIVSELLNRLSLFIVRSLRNAVCWSIRTHSNSVRIIVLHVNIDNYRVGVKFQYYKKKKNKFNIFEIKTVTYKLLNKNIYQTVRGERNI
jgi:hypothetical protein